MSIPRPSRKARSIDQPRHPFQHWSNVARVRARAFVHAHARAARHALLALKVHHAAFLQRVFLFADVREVKFLDHEGDGCVCVRIGILRRTNN